MVSVTMKELLEAGVHFGHQVRRWNPKMKEYIFGERNGIYIIDLQKTQRMFREAIAFVTNLIAEDKGKTVLFVGTKRQAQDAIREEAEKCGQYYVNQRWLGGLLTNFQTVQKSIKRLKDLESMQTDGRYEKMTKKERIKLDRERDSFQFAANLRNGCIALAGLRKSGARCQCALNEYLHGGISMRMFDRNHLGSGRDCKRRQAADVFVSDA